MNKPFETPRFVDDNRSPQAHRVHLKQRLAADYPSFKDEWGVAVVPLQEVFAGQVRPMLVILLSTRFGRLRHSCLGCHTLRRDIW